MLELICLAIVALYVIVRARIDPQPIRFLTRLFALALASFAAEDSVIRAYGFYAYSTKWTIFVDYVPIMIVLIWPVVIHSAWDLARRLDPRRAIPLAAAIVLFDASLIEPVAVNAHLWQWSEPGLFSVPPIGVLGWAIFAGLAVYALERSLWLLPLAVLMTHAGLIAAWWGALRWINVPIAAEPVVLLLWLLSIALAFFAWRARLRDRVPLIEMLLRIPGAIFFFVLLGAGSADRSLIAYAAAFAPPYLALTQRNIKKY